MVDLLRRAASLVSSFVVPAVKQGQAASGQDAWGFTFDALGGGTLPLGMFSLMAVLRLGNRTQRGSTPRRA